jgi:hypothetical protein
MIDAICGFSALWHFTVGKLVWLSEIPLVLKKYANYTMHKRIFVFTYHI